VLNKRALPVTLPNEHKSAPFLYRDRMVSTDLLEEKAEVYRIFFD
jgi:hypothetical protein